MARKGTLKGDLIAMTLVMGWFALVGIVACSYVETCQKVCPECVTITSHQEPDCVYRLLADEFTDDVWGGVWSPVPWSGPRERGLFSSPEKAIIYFKTLKNSPTFQGRIEKVLLNGPYQGNPETVWQSFTPKPAEMTP